MEAEGQKGMVLVHGMIGLPEYHTPHAWVQHVDDDWKIERDGIIYMDGTVAWEPISEGLFPVDVFVVIFRAKPMVSYTMEEMRRLVVETEHWGPWDGDYWQVEGKKVASNGH